jgi:hypothetical protein
LWLLHQVGTAYSSRPSTILGIKDNWLAYQVDLVTLMLGRRVEELLTEEKLSVTSALERLAAQEDPGPAAPPAKGTFRSLSRPGIQKMQIPENGIW